MKKKQQPTPDWTHSIPFTVDEVIDALNARQGYRFPARFYRRNIQIRDGVLHVRVKEVVSGDPG